jgi:hypothetical protein
MYEWYISTTGTASISLSFTAAGKIAEADCEQPVVTFEIEGFDTLVLEFPGETFGVFHLGERTHLDRVTQPGNALVRRSAAAADQNRQPQQSENRNTQGHH